jgi:NTE family protein
MFFTPHTINGVPLIDGGVLNPVPIAPTFDDGTGLTIAVNLGGKLISRPEPPKAIETDSGNVEIHDKILGYIQKLRDTVDVSDQVDWGVYDIANQAFDAMQSTISRQKLAAYPPDITLEVARNACGTLEFDRADEMITLGYDIAEDTLGH